jgi:hypothetical protein
MSLQLLLARKGNNAVVAGYAKLVFRFCPYWHR